MSILAAKKLNHSASASARDAAETVKSKVVQFRAAALPKAASAAEIAGEAVSNLALSTSKNALSASKNLASRLRAKQPSRLERLAAFLPAAPLARSAVRFAARNPAILAVAGVGIAAIGYIAWRRQQADLDAAVGEIEEPDSDDLYATYPAS